MRDMGTAATRHWRLILHGKRAGEEAVREAVAALRKEGLRLDVRVTWEGGDAARYAGEALADGVDAIVCGGGDGTLGEIESAAPLAFNLDGEPLEATRCRIDCVPKRLRMHLPADCPLRANAATLSA